MFEIIERDFTLYYAKTITRNAALREAPHLNGLLVEFGGDIPRSEGIKPDIMVRIMTVFERNKYTRSEELAKKLIFKLPKNLQLFVVSRIYFNEKLKKEKDWEYLTHAQVAQMLGFSIDQYNRGRARAKQYLVERVKQMKGSRFVAIRYEEKSIA